MTDAYRNQDEAHALSDETADAKVDAWEADWSSLRWSILLAVQKAGFETEGVRVLIEKVAADIIDLDREARK